MKPKAKKGKKLIITLKGVKNCLGIKYSFDPKDFSLGFINLKHYQEWVESQDGYILDGYRLKSKKTKKLIHKLYRKDRSEIKTKEQKENETKHDVAITCFGFKYQKDNKYSFKKDNFKSGFNSLKQFATWFASSPNHWTVENHLPLYDRKGNDVDVLNKSITKKAIDKEKTRKCYVLAEAMKKAEGEQ